jgi:hypothetical protein
LDLPDSLDFITGLRIIIGTVATRFFGFVRISMRMPGVQNRAG